ncbi:hypothetical protein D3C81_1571530 [compost metagenome]
MQVSAVAHVEHRTDHLVDVSTHGDFDARLLGRAPEALLVVTGLGDGRIHGTGAVINAEGTIGEAAGASDMGEHRHHHGGAGAADAVFGGDAGDLPGLVAQAVVGHGLDGVGQFEVAGIEGVLEHRNGREGTVDQAIGLVPLGYPFHQELIGHQPRTPSR